MKAHPRHALYITTTIHDFKNNIAAYIRLLESGRHKGVILKRYNAPVAALILHPEAEKKRPPPGA